MKTVRNANPSIDLVHEAVYEIDENVLAGTRRWQCRHACVFPFGKLLRVIGATHAKAMNRTRSRQRPTPVSEKTGLSGPEALA